MTTYADPQPLKPILIPIWLDVYEHPHYSEPQTGDFGILWNERCIARRPLRRPFRLGVYEYAPGLVVMRDWTPCGQEILWEQGGAGK